MTKTYKQAPLPFIGQKRNFITHFTDVLNTAIADDGDGWTIVDAFGGSGLLAHTAKRTKPQARVIYNDFDDYHLRLQHISDSNRLRQQLTKILSAAPRSKKLSPATKQAVIDCLSNFAGFVDIKTVSTWILFSGNFANSVDELAKKTLYNRIRLSDFAEAADYLNGLEIVKQDFEQLLQPYLNDSKFLFVLDPPYVCTQQGMYANDTYFGMVEFLRLMRLVRPPFIFFSSTRSELLDYLDFVIANNAEGCEKLRGYKKRGVRSHINATTSYQDNLIYRLD